MKQILLTSILSLVAISTSFCQCNKDTIVASDNVPSSIAYFNTWSVLLDSYDWKNPEINCHINGAISDYSKQQVLTTTGSVLVGVSIPLLIWGIAGKNSVLAVAGGACAAGSGFSFYFAFKHNTSRKHHTAVVYEWYKNGKK